MAMPLLESVKSRSRIGTPWSGSLASGVHGAARWRRQVCPPSVECTITPSWPAAQSWPSAEATVVRVERVLVESWFQVLPSFELNTWPRSPTATIPAVVCTMSSSSDWLARGIFSEGNIEGSSFAGSGDDCASKGRVRTSSAATSGRVRKRGNLGMALSLLARAAARTRP